MSNDERGRKLLAAAQEYLDEMRAALARDSWNIVVRHAQEVVVHQPDDVPGNGV